MQTRGSWTKNNDEIKMVCGLEHTTNDEKGTQTNLQKQRLLLPAPDDLQQN